MPYDLTDAIISDWAAREFSKEPVQSLRSLEQIAERLVTTADSRAPRKSAPVPQATPPRFGMQAPGDPMLLKIPVGEEDVVIEHRRFDCVAYDGCLSFVVAQGWPSFSCKGCAGPRGAR